METITKEKQQELHQEAVKRTAQHVLSLLDGETLTASQAELYVHAYYKSAINKMYHDHRRKNRTAGVIVRKVLEDFTGKPFESRFEHIVYQALSEASIDFQYQVKIGFYRVDFLIPSVSLIIESDGPYHAESEQKDYDERRDKWLRNQGYLVFRIRQDVWARASDKAIEVIQEIIDERKKP